MRERNQGKKNAVRGKEAFVGIDVHKESWQITAQVEGEEVFHGRIASEYGVRQERGHPQERGQISTFDIFN